MNRRRSLGLLALGAVGAALAGGCRRRRSSPEDRVRALLAEVQKAVEIGELDDVREALAPGFRGPDDLDRAAAILMLQLRRRARQELHLFTRVLNVDAEPGLPARAELLVAMAAVPIRTAEELPRLEAEVYRFRLELAEDPDGPQGYRVTSASWAPARLDELL